MARTDIQIEQEIDAEMASHPELNVLQTNTSMVAFFRAMKKFIVFVVGTIERMLEKHKGEVDATIDTTETGLEHWYLDILAKYQHGDVLIIENNRPVYPVIDEAKQIVKGYSINQGIGTDTKLYIKVAKEVSGDLVKFSTSELAALKAYFFKRRILGTDFEIISIDANLLQLDAGVKLDATIYDSNGSLLSDSTKFPVLDAINEHNKTFSFKGTYYQSRLIDTVMDVPGVIDFNPTQTKLDNVVFTTGSVSATAGYVKLDIPNSTITYVLN